MKINLYLDRFLSLTSSHVPISCQRDMWETSFNTLSFGMKLPKPRKFCLPSTYLAHTLYPEDIRLSSSGQQWVNRGKWLPANDLQSPIEVFPLASIIRAANPEHAEELPIIPDIIEDVNSQLPTLSTADIPSMPSTSKLTTHPSALADHPTSKCTGARQKKVVKRKSKPDQEYSGKSTHRDSALQIGNVLPLECMNLPDLILNLDESERFDSSDDEIQVLEQKSDSSSTSHHYVPSLTYRLQATSDVSTEPVMPLLSPDPTPDQLSPEASKYKAKPLSAVYWSEF